MNGISAKRAKAFLTLSRSICYAILVLISLLCLFSFSLFDRERIKAARGDHVGILAGAGELSRKESFKPAGGYEYTAASRHVPTSLFISGGQRDIDHVFFRDDGILHMRVRIQV
jgi:hypothetical protein